MSKQSGYIYLIKAGEHYKIGKSTNVAQWTRQMSLPISMCPPEGRPAANHHTPALNVAMPPRYDGVQP